MRHWWVNHGQTWKKEIDDGFLWSPKTAKGGRKNQGYLNMTLVRPGETVLSYADGKVSHIGRVLAFCSEEPKPDFGRHESSWSNDGWYVPVKWQKVKAPFFPARHIEKIRHLLPNVYSPIRPANGHGNQGIYLAEISYDLTASIFELLDMPNLDELNELDELDQKQAEEDLESTRIEQDSNLSTTEKSQLIMARRGQGKFKQNLRELERACRVSGTRDQRFLVASHIKPWSISDNQEKLDGNNGLLLAPHVDKLFDAGYISFSDNGQLLTADHTITELMRSWGLNPSLDVGCFREAQRPYLAFHRNHIFKGSELPTDGSCVATRPAEALIT